ncbi:MAG: flagellar hook-basal body complex protein FliE [Woeseia sp.]
MNEISPQQLLQQIRSLNSEMQATATNRPVETDGGSFSTLLQKTVDAVNETQQRSSSMKAAFVTGADSASLAQVMVASQKADLSFRAMTEVRNKLVTAYQEIMNMPV